MAAGSDEPKCKDVEAGSGGGGSGGGTPPPLQRQFSRAHFWEEDVFPQLPEAPGECKQLAKFRGLPIHCTGHKPLLLATVSGVDAAGKTFVWVARRARKRVLQPYEIIGPQPAIDWFGSLSWKHWSKPGWWVGFLFALGSLLFLITGIARMTKPVGAPEVWPPGVTSLAAGLSAWPEVIACYVVFFPACLIQVIECTNLDYSARQKKLGRPPPLRLWPTSAHLHTVSWWAAVLQVAGILLFMMGVTGDLIAMSKEVSDPVFMWTTGWGFFFGGFLFTLASLLACMEETGSWWKGVICTSMQDLRSISWVAVFSAFHGSVGFMVLGIGFMFVHMTWANWVGFMAYGQVLASCLFLTSGLAGMVEQGNPGHL